MGAALSLYCILICSINNHHYFFFCFNKLENKSDVKTGGITLELVKYLDLSKISQRQITMSYLSQTQDLFVR